MSTHGRAAKWSEREQVVTIIVSVGAALFLLWSLVLLPQNRRRRLLETQVAEMTAELERNNYLLSKDMLRNRQADEDRLFRQLTNRWAGVVQRLATLEAEESDAAAEAGHIDFKIALFDVRQRLRQKSKTAGISLPQNLGMDEKVTGDEDARRLMLQLRAVEKLTDLALDLEIPKIQEIRPLPPVMHVAGKSKQPYLEEYGVGLRFEGKAKNLYDLLQACLDPTHLFLLRDIRVEKTSLDQPESIAVNAVLCAMVFPKKPGEITPSVSAPRRALVPAGF